MECALLTDAAEAFLAQADEHIEAEVAVGRTVKVLEPPQMVAVLFDILSQNQNGDWDHVIGCLEPRERESGILPSRVRGGRGEGWSSYHRVSTLPARRCRHCRNQFPSSSLAGSAGKETAQLVYKQTNGRTDGRLIYSPVSARMRPSRGIRLRPSFDSQCNPFPCVNQNNKIHVFLIKKNISKIFFFYICVEDSVAIRVV